MSHELAGNNGIGEFDRLIIDHVNDFSLSLPLGAILFIQVILILLFTPLGNLLEYCINIKVIGKESCDL